jgi:hypothetical protein
MLSWNFLHLAFQHISIGFKKNKIQCFKFYLLSKKSNHHQNSTFLGGTTKNVTPWFSWTHQALKNHRKHLNKHFHNLLYYTFIRFRIFWYLNNIKNIVYFDLPNHYILKKFQKHNASFFLWIFWFKNTNLKHGLRIFLWIFSLR